MHDYITTSANHRHAVYEQIRHFPMLVSPIAVQGSITSNIQHSTLHAPPPTLLSRVGMSCHEKVDL